MDASRSANSIIAIVVIAIIASILIGAISGFVGILDHEVTTSPGQLSNVTEASYIIYKDGDYTCVKNGTSGRIDTRSQNATYALQYTLDRAIPGDIFYITKGTYEMNWRVIVPGDILLIGAGYGTCLEWTVSTASGLNLENYASNLTIESLYLKGVGQGVDDISGIIGAMNTHVTVINCYFSDWSGDPVTLGGPDAHDLLLTGNFVWDCDEGLEFQGVSNSAITNNFIHDTTAQGIEVTEKQVTALNPSPIGCDNIVIDGNVITNIPGRSGQSGFGLYAQGNNTCIIFSNNVVERAQYSFGTASVSGRVPDTITLTGNTFNEAIAASVYIAYGKNYAISGNTFRNSNSTAISITASVYNVTISGNIIHRTIIAGASGISISSTVSNVAIYSNSISYTKGTGITISSPKCVINSNIILSTGSYGIYINGGGNSTVCGNSVQSATTIALYINNAWNVMTMGNVLHSTNTGLKTYGSSDYNYIAFNNFRGCVVATNLVGSNNVLVNNTAV